MGVGVITNQLELARARRVSIPSRRHELIVYLHAHPASSMSSSTLDALPRIGLASVACSAAVIEFTVPQIVKLSQTSGQPLPPAPLPIRL
jgi:hypothetical protein